MPQGYRGLPRGNDEEGAGVKCTADMFEKPPRQKPRKLMHVCDAGHEGGHIAQFKCARCGYKSEWYDVENPTEAKHGLPCPKCNKVPS